MLTQKWGGEGEKDEGEGWDKLYALMGLHVYNTLLSELLYMFNCCTVVYVKCSSNILNAIDMYNCRYT